MKRKHTIAVIGLGNFGLHVARSLSRLGHTVIAVDIDEDKIQAVGRDLAKAVGADITKKEVLRTVGAGDVDLAIISLGDRIDLSALATLYLKELGVKDIWVKVISEDHAKLMRRIGASDTIFPERDMAERLARRISNPNIVERLSLAEEIGILEFTLPQSLAGKSLIELDLRRRFAVNVIAVERTDGKSGGLNPDPDKPLAAGDKLYILGLLHDLDRFQREISK